MDNETYDDGRILTDDYDYTTNITRHYSGYETASATVSSVYALSIIASTVFRLATVAVYAYVPRLRNHQGRITVCCVMCDTVPPIAQYFETGSTFVLSWFFVNASFTWTSIMSLDVWWRFRTRLRPVREEGGATRFYLVSAVGWAEAVASMAVFTSSHCSTPNDTLRIMAISAIKVLFNPVLFLFTLCNMQSRNSGTPEGGARHGAAASTGSTLYLKLLMVMGVDAFVQYSAQMVAQMGSSLFHPDSTAFQVLSSVLNLRAVLLFKFLVCNDRVLRLISEKWRAR